MDFNDKLNQIKIRDIIIIYLFSTFIVSGIIYSVVKFNHKEVGDFILNTLSLILQLVILLMLMLKIKPSRDNILLLYRDFKQKISKREIAEATLIKICIALGGSKLIVSFIFFVDPSMVNNFICESSLLINSFRNYIINAFLLLIVSPITEEIIFRSVIFNRLINKFNLCAGIVVSSIIFASFYAGSGIAGALALGIINCILYIKYKNILVPIFVNFINNLIVLISILPLINKSIDDMIITNGDVIINVCIGTILSVVGILLLMKFINRNSLMLNKYDKYIKANKECSDFK
ncbi:CPBP family intramembrane glutamic endopeptidase [uncultured Clostridium sp.]|uniref:CPBP family intramembrane glutamic endopeptidase n=1 Tax=uncultured Clostridium sp. TaxID=59620 RepID=UPI0025E044CB|nr:CPBP family intramembrane glutamic endopeptidase [uncultured Clostridium sp.]